jgi:ribosomal-protein-alanine N-acetyltransferase
MESTELDIEIRWAIIKRDTPTLLKIEADSFEDPWTEEELLRCLRQRNTIGMVAELDDDVVGFMIYELHKNRLHLASLAVDPQYRRRGIGRAMIRSLTGKIGLGSVRNRITLEVRESNLPAQLFFKSQGFRAVQVLRDFYENSTEDAYLMQYRRRD